MSVLPMSTRVPRSEQAPRTGQVAKLVLPHHPSARKSFRELLGLVESHQDSPGNDVLKRHPDLPEEIYRRSIQHAILRENLLDAHYNK